MMKRKAMDQDNILSSVMKAIAYLQKLQQENGQIIQDNYELFNVWDTIQATYALSLWHDSIELKNDDALKTILSSLDFLKASESFSGMVREKNGFKISYCAETTSEYIRLLSYLENRNIIQHQKEKENIAYLKNKQLPSGMWRVGIPEIPEVLQRFPSVTGFVLGAFKACDVYPVDSKNALHYLKTCQQEEGHWGVVWMCYGTPYYAMVPILEVMSNNSSYNESIEKAKNFLLSSQNKNGSFSYALNQNRPSTELETVLGLRSLIYCNKEESVNINLEDGLKWLLCNQKENGAWEGGEFPFPKNLNYKKREDVFCTAQVLILFHQYLIKENQSIE